MNVYIGVSGRGVVNAMKGCEGCILNFLSTTGSVWNRAIKAFWSEPQDDLKR